VFQAIDEVVLIAGDEARARRLYVDHFGFTPEDGVEVSDVALLRLWGCDGPMTATRLVKPGSTGGSIRLVCAPGIQPARPRPQSRPQSRPQPRQMDATGPFAIDFYVRGMRALHRRLRDDGYAFRSQPQRYQLFGTAFEVDEVLLEGPEGFLHALVEYLPRQHRCVLGERPDEQVSEVVAQVTVTDDLDAGLELLRDGLGGQVYFDQRFSGPVIERLIDLPSGASFRAVIMRGPERRNARMELMTQVGPGPDANGGVRRPPRLFPSVGVPSLPHVLDRIAQTSAAIEVGGPVAVPQDLGGGRAATLSTPFGVFVELRETPAG
jgi:catechol 2,3-dioxygenase-like lactoylglutathione lyase family enzyme